jgi:hypothetical protein
MNDHPHSCCSCCSKHDVRVVHNARWGVLRRQHKHRRRCVATADQGDTQHAVIDLGCWQAQAFLGSWGVAAAALSAADAAVHPLPTLLGSANGHADPSSCAPALVARVGVARGSSLNSFPDSWQLLGAWQVGAPELVNASTADTGRSSRYTIADACPQKDGIRKYICYGPCCSIPWGPGGPICLALAARAFRYAMPFTFVGWFRRDSQQDERKEPVGMKVDLAGLAFSAVLFASAAPRTAAGVAYSFAFLVLCLM